MNTKLEATEVQVGTFIGDRGDVKEHIANYQFGVREEEMVTQSGAIVPNRRAIVRTDSNQVVGTVGGNYKVLTHSEALDPIIEALNRKNVKTFQRVALTGGGAKLFANIYFPEQEINMSPNKSNDDGCWPGITVVNSLDGTLKYSLEATIYRLICTNGMRIPTTISKMKTTHSKNKDFDRIVDEILHQVSDNGRFAMLQKWAGHVMTPDAMAVMAEEIIKNKNSLFPKSYLPLVKEEIEKEARFGVVSVWGLYNAFTSVLEHNLVRDKGKVERARMLDENLYRVFETTF